MNKEALDNRLTDFERKLEKVKARQALTTTFANFQREQRIIVSLTKRISTVNKNIASLSEGE